MTLLSGKSAFPVLTTKWERQGGNAIGSEWAKASPPFPANLSYWYDGSDATQLYSDDEATTLIAGADEDVIRAITNKGTDNEAGPMVTGAADTDVVFVSSFQNSLSGFRWDADAATMTTEVGDTMTDPSLTMLLVFAYDEVEMTTVPFQRTSPETADDEYGFQMTADIMRPLVSNGVIYNMAVSDTTVAALAWSMNVGNVVDGLGSGGPTGLQYDIEVVDTGIALPFRSTFPANIESDDTSIFTVGDNMIMNFIGNQGVFGELLVWEGSHNLAYVQDYVTNKWGLSWG